jgi:hypothetical protein
MPAWKTSLLSMSASLLFAAAALAQPAVQETSDTLQDMLLTQAASVQSPLEQQVLSFYLARVLPSPGPIPRM